MQPGRAPRSRHAASGTRSVPAPPVLTQVLETLADAKAEDVVPINITGKSPLTDHMVVATGRSDRHVGAIADRLVTALKEHGFGNARVEGLPHCDWVLVDAGDVVVHIFRPEVRTFYNLEKMWQVDAISGPPLS